jgi:mannitol-1-phosphate 5-dehydrogenase
MRDLVSRVIRDPIRKLKIGDRITGPLVYAYENGLEYDGLVKSVVNVLNYYSENDAESAEMKNIIETDGVSAFLENRLKLGAYPEIVRKITEVYSKL